MFKDIQNMSGELDALEQEQHALEAVEAEPVDPAVALNGAFDLFADETSKEKLLAALPGVCQKPGSSIQYSLRTGAKFSNCSCIPDSIRKACSVLRLTDSSAIASMSNTY